MAGGVVNLRAARKAKARAEKRARGDANAAKHGRTRARKAAEEADAACARKTLDAHRLEEE
ncbi:protein of unknown function [Rhodovulum sp. ES.010]|uniref:DUF4169 family protein n=1 Tax=Rhodovulum sp. ES.010 TaxID=1882821 RepID=UPI000927B42A|nr:DUF4169 family protein [Rhodovulum sp. ES.010]SIO26528.1 protein of unknown function [Rhodovulum sp. ES.010]